MWLGEVSSVRFIGAVLFLFLRGGLLAAQAPQIPVVDGGLGSCRADFTVKDGSDKPIYNAKIHVLIKYGFLSKRKTELEVGTNSDGKASVTGLPNLPKRPLEFSIKSGTVEKTVTEDPSDNCNAKFDVTLSVR
ncbi:MAG: hypothetical protein DMG37_16250 [Acidobacteria bacterium]|nr:MAG: hypothetical protein DMG37_16250 [Acidobacteriota bacterium]